MDSITTNVAESKRMKGGAGARLQEAEGRLRARKIDAYYCLNIKMWWCVEGTGRKVVGGKRRACEKTERSLSVGWQYADLRMDRSTYTRVSVGARSACCIKMRTNKGIWFSTAIFVATGFARDVPSYNTKDKAAGTGTLRKKQQAPAKGRQAQRC